MDGYFKGVDVAGIMHEDMEVITVERHRIGYQSHHEKFRNPINFLNFIFLHSTPPKKRRGFLRPRLVATWGFESRLNATSYG